MRTVRTRGDVRRIEKSVLRFARTKWMAQINAMEYFLCILSYAII